MCYRPIDYQRFRDVTLDLSSHTQGGWKKVCNFCPIMWAYKKLQVKQSNDSSLQPTSTPFPRYWCLWCCSRRYRGRASLWQHCYSWGCVFWRRNRPDTLSMKGDGWVFTLQHNFNSISVTSLKPSTMAIMNLKDLGLDFLWELEMCWNWTSWGQREKKKGIEPVEGINELFVQMLETTEFLVLFITKATLLHWVNRPVFIC